MIVDLVLQEDQALIEGSVSAFFADQLSIERLRNSGTWGGQAEANLWPRIAELGLFGLGVSADRGGLGLSIAEEVIAAHAAGRHLVSLDIIATIAAAHLGASEEFASGSRRAAFANLLEPLRAGRKPQVHLIDSESVTDLLLCTPQGSYLLPISAASDVEDIVGMDETVSLARATLDLSACHSEDAGDGVFRRTDLLLASYLAGIAQVAMEMAVAYAKVREQFGRPIGAFQAIKHSCAEMARRSEGAICQIRYAAALAGDGDPESVDTACARYLAGEASLENARANIQIHGGMGFTYESDAHYFLKRAHLVGVLNGGKHAVLRRIIKTGN